MLWVGFEITIPALKRAKAIHALDRVAAVIGEPNLLYSRDLVEERGIFLRNVDCSGHDGLSEMFLTDNNRCLCRLFIVSLFFLINSSTLSTEAVRYSVRSVNFTRLHDVKSQMTEETYKVKDKVVPVLNWLSTTSRRRLLFTVAARPKLGSSVRIPLEARISVFIPCLC
jgi:hypothetical protein